jgi:hypothetical protein
MNILIERKWKKETYTIGRVYINGEFFSNSMEDKDRGLHQQMSEKEINAKKVYGVTAIPTGDYVVKMTYSPKYKRKMPQIMNVKGFSGIRIHSGNTATDSLGCVLLGNNDKPGWISNSRAACEAFEKMLIAAGGQCNLRIV